MYANFACSIDLELYKACDVMNSPVCTMHTTESVAHLARLLLENDHGAYPVVKYDAQSRTELMHGIISRWERCFFNPIGDWLQLVRH